MSCSTNVCGTGGGGVVTYPNDPDNNSILTATPAFGGIDVVWTYPLTNPQAVAHTRLYRSTSGTDADPTLYKIVSGSSFFDRIAGNDPVTCHYWIEIVSINGTVGERIGPATATTKPLIEDLLQYLTGQIDSGVLAQSLKEDIGRIQLNKLGIDAEMLARAENDDTLGVALNQIQAFSDGTRALLQEEVVARTTANTAFVDAVNTLYASVGETAAAIQEEKSVRASEDEALAKSIETTQSVLGNNIASVQTAMQTNVNTLNGKLTEIGALYTAKVQVSRPDGTKLIGGFGVYNDGSQVEAGFDVDRFWVGRTDDLSKIKPFIIEGKNIYFNGRVSFSNVQGAGALATKDGLYYSELNGSKPPTNADHTASNTAYDTKRVDGSSASSVKQWALDGNSAKSRVDDWTRPNETTIDGNKIFTGDAYVDTLQIKGDAVIVPAIDSPGSVLSGTGYSREVINRSIYLDQAGMFVAIFNCRQGYNSGQQSVHFELVIDGATIYSGSSGAYADYVSISGARYLGAGYRDVKVYWTAPSSVTIGNRTCVIMGVKR